MSDFVQHSISTETSHQAASTLDVAPNELAAFAVSYRSCAWLIAGRSIVALVLLLAGVLFNTSDATRQNLALLLPLGVLPLIAVTLALSIVYALLLRFSKINLRVQVGLQLALDVLLVTWLVWATGDLRSAYVAFYIVLISLATMLLGARGALITSVGCAVFYTATMFARLFGGRIFGAEDAASSTAASLAGAIQIVGFNNVAFFIVALLAARFAQRQTHNDEATNALKRLRALHERIVESIRSGVVTTDLNGLIYTVNHAAEEMTGYGETDLRGRHASRMFTNVEEQFAESSQAAAAGERSPRYEVECLTPEGLAVRLGYSIFPLSADTGERSGYVITFQDLTELRTLEELARRQDRLAAVGRVAAGIAHEIRNPLASISGSVQVLRSEVPADSMQAELMEIILRESDRLNRIINDYLTYARPRSITLSEADLREPLREVFTLLRHSPETLSNHTLEIVVPDEPVLAAVDTDALKQVFSNLARNALKAMPGGGKLQAELSRTSHGRVSIIFTDEGCGMSSKQVERLFEPFSSSTTGGTGLGLSIVYQIVRDHGGTINVQSREEFGTTITIELPSGEVRG